MIPGRSNHQHWNHVTLHFLLDATIWFATFALGTKLLFAAEGWAQIRLYMPNILFSAVLLPSALYTCSLYSPYSAHYGLRRRFLLVLFCVVVTILAILAFGSANFSARVGRGVMLFVVPPIVGMIGLHHVWLYRKGITYRERLACLVGSPEDEEEARLFQSLNQKHTEFVGMLSADDYEPSGQLSNLGKLRDAESIIAERSIDYLLCPTNALQNQEIFKYLPKLRYRGVAVVTLLDICEELYQAAPLPLVTPEWLLHASSQPRVFYVRRFKRAFDVVASLFFLLLLLPFLLLGMLAVKVTSPGPMFYRQSRCGRFGRKFETVKLRTMQKDAEENGAQWARKNDPRITPVGGFLRKFRIDEIPQLFGVLRGNMSFVGPRPERPEFVNLLAKDIPLFRERTLIQPGITGWAQVNYPYGASVEDARRKLEYDLYYMKNMSVLLDVFIILDTVRIILLGGASDQTSERLRQFQLFYSTKPGT